MNFNGNSEQNKINLKIISKCKKYFPNRDYYFFFFLICKLLGLIIISHFNIKQSSEGYLDSLANTFRVFTFFQKNNFSLLKGQYTLFCFLIYALIIAPIFLFFSIRKLFQKERKVQIKKSVYKSYMIRGFSVMISLILFFSQHLIEILSIAFIDAFLSSNNFSESVGVSSSMIYEFTTFHDSLIMSPYIFCIINFIMIIVINMMMYYYLSFINEPQLSSKSRIKFKNETNFLISFIITSNLQGVQFLDLILEGEQSQTVKITLLAICVVLIVYHLMSYDKFVFRNFPNYFIISVYFFCLMSTIYEFVFFLCNGTQVYPNTNVTLMRFVIDFIFSLVLCALFLHFKRKNNLEKVQKLIFHKHKILNMDCLYELSYMLKNSFDNNDELTHLSSLIFEHTVICKEESCTCQKLNLQNFYSKLKFKKDLFEETMFKKFNSSMSDLIDIIEREIAKSINHIKNSNSEELEDIYDFTLLHIDFILFFKRNVNLSSYLKNNYIIFFNKYKEIDFMTLVHFHAVERALIAIGKTKKADKENNMEFYKYIQLLEYINDLLMGNLEGYEKIIKFKNLYEVRKNRNKNNDNEQILYKEQKINIEEIFNTCYKMKKEYYQLMEFLKSHFSDNCFKNAEMCYLLTNFFLLVDKIVPIEMEYCFVNIEKYRELEVLENSFEEKKKNHPIILQLDNRSFIINYFSQKLCDYLGYKQNELLGHDFHVLLPEQLRSTHSSVMRNFILIKSQTYLTKDTFLLTSDGYCFPVVIKFYVLPALEDVKIIIDVHQVKNLDKQFFFILNRDLNLIAFNRDFVDKFGLTSEMFSSLQISILNFFGIYNNQVLQEFKHAIEEIEQSKNDFNKSIENANSSFFNTEKKIESNFFVKFRPISVNYLSKLQSTIQDDDLNKDWMTVILNLEKDIYRRTTANKLFTIRKKCLDKSIDSFRIQIELRKLKDVVFFFVSIHNSEVFSPNKNTLYFRHYSSLSRTNMLLDEYKIRYKETTNPNKIDTDNAQPITTHANESFKEGSTMGLLIEKHFNQDKRTMGIVSTASSCSSYVDSASSIYNIQEKKHFRKYRRSAPESHKSKKNKEKLIFYLLFLSLTVLIALSIYNVFFSSEILTSSYNIFLLNYYAVALRSVVIYGGYGVVSSCLEAGGYSINSVDGFNSSFNDYQVKLKSRSLEMNYYKYQMKTSLTKTINIAGINQILTILSTVDSYSILSVDWQVYDRNSTFEDELDSYHYYVSFLQNDNLYGKCAFNEKGVYSQIPGAKAKLGEITTHYSIYNMMRKLKVNLNSITTATYGSLKEYHQSSQHNLLYSNMYILLIFLILCFSVIFSILHQKRKIYSVLKFFFQSRRIEEKLFENKIMNFKKVLISIDKHVALKYEKKKQDLIDEIQKENDINKKKKITRLSNKKEDPFIAGKKSIHPVTENTFQSNMFHLNMITYSIYIVIAFIILYVVVIFLNIYSNQSDFNTLLFSNQISMSFIDRIPRLAELLLYYVISIVNLNENFIERNQTDYPKLTEAYNPYNIVLHLATDSLYTTLPTSEFSYVLYKIMLERMNINTFMASASEILPSVRKIEQEYSSENSCFTIGYYNTLYTINKDLNYTDMRSNFDLMSSYVKECRSINKGMNLKGLNLAMDNHITSLSTLYLEFFQSKERNRLIPLFDVNFMRAQVNTEYALKKAQDGLLGFILIDMNTLYEKIKNVEYIFSSLKIILGFSFIFYFVFFVLFKIQNYFYYINSGIKKFVKAASFT